MRIHLWGVDFRRGSQETRHQLYATPEEREPKLREFLRLGFSDVVYLATCNRIEFFTTAKDYFYDMRSLWSEALTSWGLSKDAYYTGYHLEGKAAVRHLMRVASSLESLVVGEPQILGQLKEALKWSQEHGIPVSPSLVRCFQLAFETAKRVRTETSIAEKPVSVASLGLSHLQAREAEYPLTRAVVVGRSPISLVCLQWLAKNRPQCPVIWVNRTPEALKAYPESENVEVVSLADFLASPPSFSHLFTATSSREPVFTDDFFKKGTSGKRMVFDFAEPHDVVISGGSTAELAVLALEDLREEAKANTLARARAVEEAEVMVESALKTFCLQQKEGPLIRDFNAVEPAFLEELTRALELLKQDVPEAVHPKVKRWAESLVRKNLHNSREHLRLVLRKVTDPEESASLHLY